MLEGSVQAFSDQSPDSPVVVCTPGADPTLQQLEAETGTVANTLRNDVLLAIKVTLEALNDSLDFAAAPLQQASNFLNQIAPHYDMTKSGEGVRVAADMYTNLLVGKVIEGAGPVLRAGAGKLGQAVKNSAGTLGNILVNLFKQLNNDTDKSALARQILENARQYRAKLNALKPDPSRISGRVRQFTVPRKLALGADMTATQNAYKAALQAGEISIQAPSSGNLLSDFITAQRNASGQLQIIVTDVNTSVTGKLPGLPAQLTGNIVKQVEASIAALQKENPALANELNQALRSGRIQMRQVSATPALTGQNPVPAQSSYTTAIQADIGESAAWKLVVRNGEIPLQSPFGANVPGVDFITAVRNASGQIEIIATDVKTSVTGNLPKPIGKLPASWMNEVRNAVANMKVGNPQLEAEIRQALAQGRVIPRQIDVNYSKAGRGKISFP